MSMPDTADMWEEEEGQGDATMRYVVQQQTITLAWQRRQVFTLPLNFH